MNLIEHLFNHEKSLCFNINHKYLVISVLQVQYNNSFMMLIGLLLACNVHPKGRRRCTAGWSNKSPYMRHFAYVLIGRENFSAVHTPSLFRYLVFVRLMYIHIIIPCLNYFNRCSLLIYKWQIKKSHDVSHEQFAY